MFPEKTFPLQQGALDSLCAVYSVLNCMNALGELGSVREAEQLFQRVIRWSGKHGNVAEAICQGFDPISDDVSEINEIARKASRRNLLAEPQILEPGSDLAAMIDQSPSGGLVYFRDHDDRWKTHYTMVRKRKGRGTFPLWDSYGFKALTVTDKGVSVDGRPVTVTHFWSARLKRKRQSRPG